MSQWLYVQNETKVKDENGNVTSSVVYPGELIDVEIVPEGTMESMYNWAKNFITGSHQRLGKIKSLKSANISKRKSYTEKPNVAGRFIIITYTNGVPSGEVRIATNAEIVSYQVKTVTTKDGTQVTLTQETASVTSSTDLPRNQIMEQSDSGEYIRLTETVGDNSAEGLRIQYLKGVLGIPHQFLPTTDPRVTMGGLSYNGLGRIYAKFIVKHMPLLIITPGVPKFMGSAGSTEKRNVLQALMAATIDSVFNLASGKPPQGSYSGKYYTLNFQYSEYFKGSLFYKE